MGLEGILWHADTYAVRGIFDQGWVSLLEIGPPPRTVTRNGLTVGSIAASFGDLTLPVNRFGDARLVRSMASGAQLIFPCPASIAHQFEADTHGQLEGAATPNGQYTEKSTHAAVALCM
jgi:hypothetical protein